MREFTRILKFINKNVFSDAKSQCLHCTVYFVGGAPLNGGNCVRQDLKLICFHPLSKVFSCKCRPLSLFSALFVHQKLKKVNNAIIEVGFIARLIKFSQVNFMNG